MNNNRNMVGRSTYQKVVEENKKLKADLKTICYNGHFETKVRLMQDWMKHFKEEERRRKLMQEAAQNYIKNNWDSFPEDLKKLLNKNREENG